MSDDLNRMIEKGRRVVRSRGGDPEGPAVPPGFVDRVMRARQEGPSGNLLVWQRVSWAGTACALLIALGTMWQVRNRADASVVDPWMEMPMEVSEGGTSS